MQCREVKRRLNERIELSDELKSHIKSCPACSKEWQLAGMLDLILDTEKKSDSYEASSFAAIKARVKTQSADSFYKEISFMAKVKKEIEKHPGFSFGIAFTVLATVIMLLVPVSYNKTIGYDMSFKGVKSASIVSQEQLLTLARALGYGSAEVSIKESERGYDYVIANLPSRRATQAMEVAMVELTGSKGRVEVKPVVKKVSGNLYAQVRERVKIEIKSENKTSDEIKKEIKQRLKDLGLDAGRVEVKVNEYGVRQITLFPSDSTGETAFDKDIWLDINENGDIDIGLLEDHPYGIIVDTENKTADEIKKEIIDKLKAKGVEDPQVEVIQEEDGQTQIKVKPGKKD